MPAWELTDEEEIIGPFSYGNKIQKENSKLTFGMCGSEKKNRQKIYWGARKTKSMIDLVLVEREKCKQKAMPREKFEGDHKITVPKLSLIKLVKLKEKREVLQIKEKFQKFVKELVHYCKRIDKIQARNCEMCSRCMWQNNW